jgi:hypothetical protein
LEAVASQHGLDPDAIFRFDAHCECDLASIFQRQSISYAKRYSTGEWENDGLSVTEEIIYKRECGFGEAETSNLYLTALGMHP